MRISLLALTLVCVTTACSPPPVLTPAEEALVRRCLELGYKQESAPECEQVTKPMEKSFLAKHPDFYETLLADRKKLVEDQIAKDVRQRDELNVCLDEREGGSENPASCGKFMAHEIRRGLEDRRRTRCATSTLDRKPDAAERCRGLSEQEIAEEVQMEERRRERRR